MKNTAFYWTLCFRLDFCPVSCCYQKIHTYVRTYIHTYVRISTHMYVHIRYKSLKKCPDVLSVLRSIALSVRTYGTRQKKVSVRKGKVHGRDSEASCPTRTTTQRFYRPMPLLSLYLVLSLSSSSFFMTCTVCTCASHRSRSRPRGRTWSVRWPGLLMSCCKRRRKRRYVCYVHVWHVTFM